MKNLIVREKSSKLEISKSSKICLDLCAGMYKKGLHLTFITTRKGVKANCHIIVNFKNDIIAAFELRRAEKVFWKIMKELRKKGLQEYKMKK